ncbi:hypothetical protein [Mesorhizobium sp. M0701]|uniref:VOC family protein n=1 Tax=Mesorhizobium sp. M0701 TaxID=2956989 RepID=UPI0033392812
MHIQFAELPVFDQERAKAFYIDHLNCRVVADQPMGNDGCDGSNSDFQVPKPPSTS